MPHKSDFDLERHVRLDTAAISPLLSAYFAVGPKNVRKDVFDFVSVDVKGRESLSCVRMEAYFQSPTDPQGFHLGGPVTMEIVCQLAIIHGYALLGKKKKDKEVWMGTYAVRHREAVRDPEAILVTLTVAGARRAKSQPDSLAVLDFTFDIGGGKVTGEMSTYFEL